MESVSMLAVIVILISYFIIELQSVPHVPILLAVLIMITYGFARKFSFKHLQEGMVQGAQSGMGAVLIFFLIGILISSWMASGTIPALMDVSFALAGGSWFLAIVFTITAITGVALGSSFTTSATLGVAFLGVAQSMDASLAMTAGAIVSGAFFGDKMSPLSDTTNLASTVVKVDLFEHIKNMTWTTVPAFIISFILFAVLSPQKQVESENLNTIECLWSGPLEFMDTGTCFTCHDCYQTAGIRCLSCEQYNCDTHRGSSRRVAMGRIMEYVVRRIQCQHK